MTVALMKAPISLYTCFDHDYIMVYRESSDVTNDHMYTLRRSKTIKVRTFQPLIPSKHYNPIARLISLLRGMILTT